MSERFEPMQSREIAIIGMSGRFPGARNLREFWANLVEGRVSIGEVPASRWDAEALYDPDPKARGKSVSKWGGFIDDADVFDPRFFRVTPRDAVYMDPQQRLFLEAGRPSRTPATPTAISTARAAASSSAARSPITSSACRASAIGSRATP
ncbi:hypothetical protein BE20_42140 [Sorangium cellulosum]|nr:hypothetical protein BE20_42140 [Sorangium cellulosum]